jgi:hypothetical protein
MQRGKGRGVQSLTCASDLSLCARERRRCCVTRPRHCRRATGGGGLRASCSLSEPLQKFLGVESVSRPQVVKMLWEYIKTNNLQVRIDGLIDFRISW